MLPSYERGQEIEDNDTLVKPLILESREQFEARLIRIGYSRLGHNRQELKDLHNGWTEDPTTKREWIPEADKKRMLSRLSMRKFVASK